ncbi:hypothetical protein BV25DRAFT_1831222 [Artomyces pyxidatus]|uniref:Uncharacterized protein n=1 Tax=Artomyces pyxidatus TaxID=48021 RepID=A0ACB8SND1_9AGAM|nr:hypothetical protein BV25DRAFT_1831222 [Artomyces pyxidatus]
MTRPGWTFRHLHTQLKNHGCAGTPCLSDTDLSAIKRVTNLIGATAAIVAASLHRDAGTQAPPPRSSLLAVAHLYYMRRPLSFVLMFSPHVPG